MAALRDVAHQLMDTRLQSSLNKLRFINPSAWARLVGWQLCQIALPWIALYCGQYDMILHVAQQCWSWIVGQKSPDSKAHGANMGGPIWDRQDPGGPHVGPMNFAIWVILGSRYGLYAVSSLEKLITLHEMYSAWGPDALVWGIFHKLYSDYDY